MLKKIKNYQKNFEKKSLNLKYTSRNDLSVSPLSKVVIFLKGFQGLLPDLTVPLISCNQGILGLLIESHILYFCSSYSLKVSIFIT